MGPFSPVQMGGRVGSGRVAIGLQTTVGPPFTVPHSPPYDLYLYLNRSPCVYVDTGYRVKFGDLEWVVNEGPAFDWITQGLHSHSYSTPLVVFTINILIQYWTVRFNYLITLDVLLTPLFSKGFRFGHRYNFQCTCFFHFFSSNNTFIESIKNITIWKIFLWKTIAMFFTF